MKKIVIKKTNDILYYDTLDNGLQVFMIPKDKVNTTFVSFNVNYGSIHTSFVPLGGKKMEKVPYGIAHFLEHKMFEQENGIDPMQFYAANGADVNAYTSLYNTAYHFSCSSHLKENLTYLLDFIQAPYFTDENVKSEQGIIEEEINMYKDLPYIFLQEEIRINTFENHPIIHPIAGSVEDIMSITKEDLYKCYDSFYHPSNMFLVITGNFDVDEMFEIVKDNQQAKEFKNVKYVIIKKYLESDDIPKNFEEKEMSVEVPKISLGVKIPLKNITITPKKRDIYLSILLDSLFGSTSLFNEEMKNKGYLFSYVSINTFYTDKHILITIDADTANAKELIAAIKKNLTSPQVNEEDFNNKIKKIISDNIQVYDDVTAINHTVVNDLIIYGKYYPNVDKILRELNIEEFKNFIKQLDFNHQSVLIVKPLTK